MEPEELKCDLYLTGAPSTLGRLLRDCQTRDFLIIRSFSTELVVGIRVCLGCVLPNPDRHVNGPSIGTDTRRRARYPRNMALAARLGALADELISVVANAPDKVRAVNTNWLCND